MLFVISPAKTINFSKQEIVDSSSVPEFLNESALLVKALKKYSPSKLTKLMKVNSKIAQLNYDRYQEWSVPFTSENAKQSLLCFKGEVYSGINADDFYSEDFDFAQNHLRILSGLYGILKPLDLMQPYRLEMGTPLKFRRKKNLYEFWGDNLAKYLLKEFESIQVKTLINLASNEYYKTIDKKLANIRIVTPVFKDNKDGEYKFIHVFGKKARGLMSRFIIKNRITIPEEIKLFDYEGYEYNDRMSKEDEWVFTRG